MSRDDALHEGEGRIEFGRKGSAVILPHRKAAAHGWPIGSKRPDDHVATDWNSCGGGRDIGGPIVSGVKEVKDRPVVPNLELSIWDPCRCISNDKFGCSVQTIPHDFQRSFGNVDEGYIVVAESQKMIGKIRRTSADIDDSIERLGDTQYEIK